MKDKTYFFNLLQLKKIEVIDFVMLWKTGFKRQ